MAFRLLRVPHKSDGAACLQAGQRGPEGPSRRLWRRHPERARNIVACAALIAALGILAPIAHAQDETFQVVSVNTTGCNSGNFGMTVERANLDGGSYIVRTIVTVGALIYMNEQASISVNGLSGWNVFNNFTYGPVPNQGPYPIPMNQRMRLDFTLERPKGTVLYSWLLIVDGCNTGSILFNGPLSEVPILVVGAGLGGGPHVRVYGATGLPVRELFAYDPDFTGGVRVALGDVSGDGIPDIITGAGPGGGPHVRAFDGVTGAELKSFFAYPAGFTGGVFVAAGDVNGDGAADIITGAGAGGGPHVQVFDGATGAVIRSFFAHGAGFTGGVFVAAGDVNGDGAADIITGAGAGGGPHVQVFDGVTGAVIRSFFAYGAGFTGGVSVAAGDVNGDGKADIITGAGPGGGPHVQVFDGVTGAVIRSFFAYGAGFTGGVSVAAGDVNGDGKADIITGAGPGGGPHVRAFDSVTGLELLSFFAFEPGFTGGIFVSR